MWNIQPGCLAIVSASIMLIASNAQSQHLLVKKSGNEYVGVRVTEKMFQACGDHKIPIEDGVVSNTDRKCPKPPKLTAILPGAVVQEVDLSSRTFNAKIPNMGVKKFYFPEVSENGGESNVWFLALKPGDKLKINAWKLSEDHDHEIVWVTKDVWLDKPNM